MDSLGNAENSSKSYVPSTTLVPLPIVFGVVELLKMVVGTHEP